MDRFRLGSLALSFQVGFRFCFSCDLFWPLISSWLRTGGMLDEAGRTWQVTQEMELEWHGPGSNIIFQSSLHSYTIHVHLYTLIKLLSWAYMAYTILRPCPIAALQVLDSKVTGTANCMGLGFESWWQLRNIESSELHEIRKPMQFCKLRTKWRQPHSASASATWQHAITIFKFKSKAIYTQKSWHFRLEKKASW